MEWTGKMIQSERGLMMNVIPWIIFYGGCSNKQSKDLQRFNRVLKSFVSWMHAKSKCLLTSSSLDSSQSLGTGPEQLF